MVFFVCFPTCMYRQQLKEIKERAKTRVLRHGPCDLAGTAAQLKNYPWNIITTSFLVETSGSEQSLESSWSIESNPIGRIAFGFVKLSYDRKSGQESFFYFFHYLLLNTFPTQCSCSQKSIIPCSSPNE